MSCWQWWWWWWLDGGKRLLKEAFLYNRKTCSKNLANNKMSSSKQSRGSLFTRQTSISHDYPEKPGHYPRPSTTTTITSPLSTSTDTFLLFAFYGISLSSSLTPSSPFKVTALWVCRLMTLGSMLFLLGSTGSSAFTKDDSAEKLLGNSSITGSKPIPALSSLNLKFYYRLSFHLKSYFCLLSYLYVLFRTSDIRQVVLDIIVRLNEKTGDGRRLVVVRRILAVVWVVNVAANGAFFAWNAIDVELSADLELLGGWGKLIEEGGKVSTKSQLRQKVALCLLKELLWAFYGFGWLITGVLFMIWITYANYLVEKEVFRRQLRLISYRSILATSGQNSLAELLLASRPSAELPKYRSLLPLYTALQTLTCLQESINAHLGLLPFFWLCELFLSTCLRITQVALLAGVRPSGGPNGNLSKVDKSLRSTIEYHLEYFVEYLVLTAFYVAFIAIVEWFASQRVTLYQLERALLDAVDFEASRWSQGGGGGGGGGLQNSRFNYQGSYVFQGRVVGGGPGGGSLTSEWMNSPRASSSQQHQTLVLLTVAVAHKYIDSR